MADITAEDLANLVGAANSLVQTFENKEADINSKITDLVQAVNTKLSGDFKTVVYTVDAINGNDLNSGTVESPLRTLDAAFDKISPVFSYTEIRLKGSHTYTITKNHLRLAGTLIRIYGIDASSYQAIRAGATDDRPEIVLDVHGITPGDGPINETDGTLRSGLDPIWGLNITFNQCVITLPQGFDGDTDKSNYAGGPKFIQWTGVRNMMSVSFVACRINFGLGGVVSVSGQCLMSVGASGCDFYVNPDAVNTGCRSLIVKGSNTTLTYAETDVNFYHKETGLELSSQQALDLTISSFTYSGQDSYAQPIGVLSNVNFSRFHRGLI